MKWDYKSKEAISIGILVIIIALSLGFRWYNNMLMRQPLIIEQSETKDDPAEEIPLNITVHVMGAVLTPGVYTFPLGVRAVDALQAAGGPLPEADQHAFNLAQPLYDGQRIEIPFKSENKPMEGGGEPSSAGSNLVNINTAVSGELETLPGIGPTRAGQIIAYREQNGFFQSVEELAQVSGIGEKTLATLRELVTIY